MQNLVLCEMNTKILVNELMHSRSAEDNYEDIVKFNRHGMVNKNELLVFYVKFNDYFKEGLEA